MRKRVVPPSYGAYTPLPLVPFDVDKADATLEAAGWKREADGIRAKGGQRLAIELVTVTGVYDELVELLRSWWAQLGVDLQTRTYASAIFYQPQSGILFGGTFDATIVSIQNFPFIYPSLLYGCDRIPPNGLNIPRYCNPKLDAIMRRYERTYDVREQARYLTEISRILDADVPMFVLAYADNVIAVSKRIRNFDPNAITFFDAMMRVAVA